MEIDVSKCPHILIKEGAFDDGEYIDDANACKLRGFTYPGDVANSYHMCDSDCEWFQLQQLKESNKTLNKMLLILNDRLDEYKRIYGEL